MRCDLAYHFDYDRDGYPQLVVYKKWKPTFDNNKVTIPLKDAWQIMEQDERGMFWKCLGICQKLGVDLGKKPGAVLSRIAIFLMDAVSVLYGMKNCHSMDKPKEKIIGEIDLYVDGKHTGTTEVRDVAN